MITVNRAIIILPISQMKKLRSGSLSQDTHRGWSEDLWLPVLSDRGPPGLPLQSLASRHSGGKAPCHWPAKSSLLCDGATFGHLLSITHPLELGSAILLWALPSPPFVSTWVLPNSPGVSRNPSEFFPDQPGSASMPGVSGCIVIGLGEVTHFSLLGSTCNLWALSLK